MDLIQGSFDLALRNAVLADSSLKARKLADDTRVLCASPAYLARHGTPERPESEAGGGGMASRNARSRLAMTVVGRLQLQDVHDQCWEVGTSRPSKTISPRPSHWRPGWRTDSMSETTRIADLPEFDITEHLEDDQAIAEYLTVVLEDDDPALLATALGDIARARGMTEIARLSGITREALYKALRADAAPRFDTINRVCHALGVKLVAQTR